MTRSRTFLFSLCLLAPLTVVAQPQFDVFEAGISEIRDALDGGQVSSVQLVQQYLDRIQAYDKQGPKLNSIVRVNPQALAQAQALDTERENGFAWPSAWRAHRS
jgi:Asp-tRNA(Asn)/Glu-tRNA(Gln) amidotransferase A subunit family amidase